MCGFAEAAGTASAAAVQAAAKIARTLLDKKTP
jgi:hypothetical protein